MHPVLLEELAREQRATRLREARARGREERATRWLPRWLPRRPPG